MSSIDLTEKDAFKIFRKAKTYGMIRGGKFGLAIYPFVTMFVIANFYVHDRAYYHELFVSVSFWLVVLMILPSAFMLFFACVGQFWYAFKTMKSLQHALAGRCMQCGYDMRGAADRCPECNSEQTVLMRRLDHLR